MTYSSSAGSWAIRLQSPYRMMPLLRRIIGRGAVCRARRLNRASSDSGYLFTRLAQRAEGRAELCGERLRRLPGREVPARVDLVERTLVSPSPHGERRA